MGMKLRLFLMVLGLPIVAIAGIKEQPPHPPAFYQQIAEATYHGREGQYSHLPSGWIMQDRDEVKGPYGTDWHFYLYKNLITGEHIVGFRGSKDTRDVLVAGADQIDKVSKSMNKKLKKWSTQSGGTVSAYVGHSAGGLIASHVDHYGTEPFRITFNAYNPKRRLDNPRRIYLRVQGDPVSNFDTEKHIALTCPGLTDYSKTKKVSNPKHPHALKTFGKIFKYPGCGTWFGAFGPWYFSYPLSRL